MIKQMRQLRSEKQSVWSQLGFHRQMIADKVRTLSYKRAIEENVKNGDVVLDLGCGTGILSFFAVKRDCRKVYAVDNTPYIINSAAETAKLNSLDRNIEFVKCDILQFKPKERIDVLIHDQIGSYLWNEGILSKVGYIRDNYLKREGIIIPFKIELYLAPVSHESDVEKNLSFWCRKRYGINFSNLGIKEYIQNYRSSMRPSLIELKDTNPFLCREKLVYIADLRKDKKIPRKITATYQLKKNSKLTGMCGYFKVYLDENHVFTTKPRNMVSHWKQIFLSCPEKKVIKLPSTLNFTLFPNEDIKKWRFKFDITTNM